MSARYRQRYEWTADRVYALRQHLGLTQRQFAEELGTEQQRISEWETGVHHPGRITTTLLALVAERAGFEYPDSKTLTIADGETPEAFQKRPVSDLGLGPRATTALRRAGVTEIGQILDLLAQGNLALLAIPDFGRRSLEQLRAKLRERGLRY